MQPISGRSQSFEAILLPDLELEFCVDIPRSIRVFCIGRSRRPAFCKASRPNVSKHPVGLLMDFAGKLHVLSCLPHQKDFCLHYAHNPASFPTLSLLLGPRFVVDAQFFLNPVVAFASQDVPPVLVRRISQYVLAS